MVVSLGPPIASYAQPRSVPYVLPAPYNQDQVARQNTQYRSLTLVRNIWHRSFHHQSTTLMGWTCPQSAQWQDPEGCLLLWTAVRFQVSRSSKAALQRQLGRPICSPLASITNMGGSCERQIEVADNLPHWCAALRGESYSLGHGKSKVTEGSCCQSQSYSRAFEHLPLQHLWSTMHCKDWLNRSHESQKLVRDQSSYIVLTGDSIVVKYG